MSKLTNAVRALQASGTEGHNRTSKPRSNGISLVLDTGLGINAIRDYAAVNGDAWDFAKIAWGSALITANLVEKIELYRELGIEPLLGGTLFEYMSLRGKLDDLLAFVKGTGLHVEVSDGVISLSEKQKLEWISRLAQHATVYSEVGGKTASHDLKWDKAIQAQKDAGASRVVIEGREVGPVGKDIREDLVDFICSKHDPSTLLFESLERPQQVWFIKKLGPNVNLGNIRPWDLATLEAFRRGLKEHTLLHFHG